MRGKVGAPNVCIECRETKPLTDFYKNGKAASGYQWKCKACIVAYNRALHLRNAYGMTVADYHNMLAAQDGGCAVCGRKSANRKGHSMHVDHDHVTGKVRAILCANCNVTLGQVQDNAEVLRKLADYIESF